jgi:hypothetical protein
MAQVSEILTLVRDTDDAGRSRSLSQVICLDQSDSGVANVALQNAITFTRSHDESYPTKLAELSAAMHRIRG